MFVKITCMANIPRLHETTAGSLTARAAAFGMPTVEIDGQDVRQVYKTTLQLVERARQG